jgi:Ulp1 family protease
MNGSDCGMFACKFAEYITRDAAISFTQVSDNIVAMVMCTCSLPDRLDSDYFDFALCFSWII